MMLFAKFHKVGAISGATKAQYIEPDVVSATQRQQAQWQIQKMWQPWPKQRAGRGESSREQA